MTAFRLSNPSIVVQFTSMSKLGDCNRKRFCNITYLIVSGGT